MRTGTKKVLAVLLVWFCLALGFGLTGRFENVGAVGVAITVWSLTHPGACPVRFCSDDSTVDRGGCTRLVRGGSRDTLRRALFSLPLEARAFAT